MTNIEIFKKCMKDEADAIINSIDCFGTEIDDATNIILNMKGKLVVMGVGKSGHVGEKIAATLASTGTPSFFVHATEAVHGDLGMIGKDDVVILISNSGETKEVLNALVNIKKQGIKTISITKNKNSTLAKNTDIAICYKYKEECDHLHLAPTVSSTLTLVVGDALAVLLCEKRGFTAEDFHLYHPGGSLGKMLEK